MPILTTYLVSIFANLYFSINCSFFVSRLCLIVYNSKKADLESVVDIAIQLFM